MIRTDYRFAERYQPRELLESPERADAFVRDYLTHEADYFQEAREAESGLTFDGFELDKRSGELSDVRFWSAPSKECLDMGILIKALGGDEKAALLVTPHRAAEILREKLDSYESFARQQPGYGGMLPWFYSGTPLHATPDWHGDCPGLDNGEWLWTMLVAEKALKDSGHTELAERYARYNEKLQENVVKMFFDPEACKVRGDVHISDPYSADATYSTNHGVPGRADYLSDVHEGQMMVLYLTLMGKGLPEGASERIWDGIKFTRVEHEAGTTWQGWYGSAHESWAYLFLPLRDLEGYRQLFRVREEIRTQNAAQRGYPGFATSANQPGEDGYLDGAGIEGVGSLPVRNNHTFAIYGAFPLLLEFAGKTGPNPGLVWLHNMLLAPQMQGPFGGGEAGTNDGRLASNVKTVDGTMPNILALLGGLEKETAAVLREKGVYDRFCAIMQHEYEETFGDAPLRESGVFALPTTQVPQGLLPPYGPDLKRGGVSQDVQREVPFPVNQVPVVLTSEHQGLAQAGLAG